MKTKRLWVFTIILIILAGTPVVAQSTVSFSDVRPTDWFYSDVSFLVENGIVNGFGDGTFRPGDKVGVDAFIKMMVTSLGHDPGIGSGYWASNYIETAEELGILNPDWFDSYTRPIERGEMALLTASTIVYLENLQPYRQYEFHLEDYSGIDTAEQEAVLINVSKGIITGYEDYTFRADRTATRAEAATMVSRIIDETRRKGMDYFEDMRMLLANKEWELQQKAMDDFEILDGAMEALLNTGITMDSTGAFDTYRMTFEHNLFTTLQNIALGAGDGWQSSVNSGTGTEYYAKTDDPYGGIISVAEDAISYSEYNLANTWSYMYEMDLNGGYSVIQAYDKVNKRGLQLSAITTTSGTDHHLQEFVDDGNSGLSVDYYENHDYYYDSDSNVAMHIEGDYLQVQAYDNALGDGVCFIMFPDGASYVGKLTGYGYLGSGQLEYEDGTRFIGRFKNLSLNGDGVLIYPNGTVLEGEFEDTFAISRHAEITGPEGTLGDFDRLLDVVISESIKDFMNNNAKIKALHDYLVLNVEYASNTIQNELSDLDYNNPYAALAEGSSVCLGYAQTLNLLLNRIGIESYVVIGDADKDGDDDHAWNYVRFDDGFYHVDATWDDPDMGNRIDSRFFKVSDSQMRVQRNVTAIIGL